MKVVENGKKLDEFAGCAGDKEVFAGSYRKLENMGMSVILLQRPGSDFLSISRCPLCHFYGRSITSSSRR